MMYAYDDGRNQNHSWGLPVERETRYLYFEYIMIDITSPATHNAAFNFPGNDVEMALAINYSRLGCCSGGYQTSEACG